MRTTSASPVMLRAGRAALAGLVLAVAALAGCAGAEENAEAVDSAQEKLTDSADAVSGFGPVSGDTAPRPLQSDSVRDTTARDTSAGATQR